MLAGAEESGAEDAADETDAAASWEHGRVKKPFKGPST